MKNIIKQLQNLDFTQYEAKAYISLLSRERVSGYELAKNSGIPASKIYQVLNRLLDKEVIVALDSVPKKYAPIPPEEILSRFRGDYLQIFNELDDGLSRIYKKEHIANNYIFYFIIFKVIFIKLAYTKIHNNNNYRNLLGHITCSQPSIVTTTLLIPILPVLRYIII